MLFLILVSGFTVVAPNQARVVLFFGRYVGTLCPAGFHWTVPTTVKRRSEPVRDLAGHRPLRDHDDVRRAGHRSARLAAGTRGHAPRSTGTAVGRGRRYRGRGQ